MANEHGSVEANGAAKFPDADARGTVHIDLIELGAASMLEAVLSVARTTMAQQTLRAGGAPGPFVGFIQALVEHREGFTHQVVAKVLAEYGQ